VPARAAKNFPRLILFIHQVVIVRVTFACPQCEAALTLPLEESTQELVCPACGHHWPVPAEAVTAGEVHRCVICPSEELYVRKDFPQKLGILIVVFSIILSSITWYYRMIYATYGIFFAMAALDFALWFLMGNMLQCYRCQTQYRGLAGLEKHDGFDLETHEKHRQQLIRLAEAEAEQAAKQNLN
jgi:hypothetical protein